MNRPVAMFAASALAFAIAIGCCAGAARAESDSICRRTEVLSFAAAHLAGSEAHIALIAESATEIATSRGDVVLCAVSVRTGSYDADVYRNLPATITQPRYFEVRRLRNGFEVDFTGR